MVALQGLLRPEIFPREVPRLLERCYLLACPNSALLSPDVSSRGDGTDRARNVPSVKDTRTHLSDWARGAGFALPWALPSMKRHFHTELVRLRIATLLPDRVVSKSRDHLRQQRINRLSAT